MSSTLTEQQQQSTLATSPLGSRQNSPPFELRRITSNGNIVVPRDNSNGNREHRLSARQSQLLQTAPRLGSRSPASIPSSPTSVHSSSSAIFERDIEPTTPAPPTFSHTSNPHLIPRSKGTEAIEQSVPSVLDSAAAVLASTSPEEEDFVAVLAPAPDLGYASGYTSPSGFGSSRSRSPSPGAHAHRTSLLLNLPSPTSGSVRTATTTSQSPSSPTRPTVFTQQQSASDSSQPITTPTSAYSSAGSDGADSPTTTTLEHPPEILHTPTSNSNALSPLDTIATLPSTTLSSPLSGISHPPSPKGAAKRLSFMSYADLLSSTPTSTLPLSSLTSSAVVSEPPPHIPSVSSGFANSHSTSHSAASSIHHVHAVSELARMKEGPVDPILLEEDGGEWEREGLGKGLEERLEAVLLSGRG